MKCMLNPISGEIKRVLEHEAKHLASYGWRYLSKEQYKSMLLQKAFSNMAGLKQGMRRV